MMQKRIGLLAQVLLVLIASCWGVRAGAASHLSREQPGSFPPALVSTVTDVPSTLSVCAKGCDFSTIQSALDDADTTSGAVIAIADPIHTEAGIHVTKDVTIQGRGAELTIVQAHATMEQAPDRVFFISEQAVVTIRDLTIRHGNPHLDEDWRHGGGILNKGTLTLQRCVVSHNTGNTGGGILTNGPLVVDQCIISHNAADRIAQDGWDDGDGGGIEVDVGDSLIMIDSTISNNFAEFNGGGVYVDWNCPSTIINSTFSGNRAVTYGGGLYIKNETYLIHATLVGNQATGLPAINQIGERTPQDDVHTGGGVYLRAVLHFTNTIIAENFKEDCSLSYPDAYGIRGSLGTNLHNLVGDGSCEAEFSGDPLLAGLAHNGAATLTHALRPGSPAIDAAPAGETDVVTDQRALPRPIPCETPDTPVDLGAYEVQADECVLPDLSPTPTARPPTPTPSPMAQEPSQESPDGNPFLPLGLAAGFLLLVVGAILLWRRYERDNRR